jgi:hypothetical protein
MALRSIGATSEAAAVTFFISIFEFFVLLMTEAVKHSTRLAYPFFYFKTFLINNSKNARALLRDIYFVVRSP